MTLARMLADAREQAGRSVVDVARALGVSHTTIWRWERETESRAPSMAHLALYLDAVGVHGARQQPYFVALGLPEHVLDTDPEAA